MLAVICVILSLSAVLCACDAEKTIKEAAETVVDEIRGTPIVDDEEEDVENEFFNDSNYLYEPNAVNVRPRYMYWDGDTLVAECFISSGLQTTAYNLEVENLRFENEDGVIAEGAFGLLEGATVGSNSHIVWTFRFSGEAVKNAGADLTGGIGSAYDIGYNH